MGARDTLDQLEAALEENIRLEADNGRAENARRTAEHDRDAYAGILMTVKQSIETLAGTERIEALAAIYDALITHSATVTSGHKQIRALAAGAFTEGATTARRDVVLQQATMNIYDGTWIA